MPACGRHAPGLKTLIIIILSKIHLSNVPNYICICLFFSHYVRPVVINNERPKLMVVNPILRKLHGSYSNKHHTTEIFEHSNF